MSISPIGELSPFAISLRKKCSFPFLFSFFFPEDLAFCFTRVGASRAEKIAEWEFFSATTNHRDFLEI